MGRRTPLEYLDSFVSKTAHQGLLHCNAEDERLTGRTVQIEGRSRVHFGSCSYLGLELDERLKAGVIDAVGRYGTQFSSSRSYLSSPLYGRLEERLEEILGGATLVTPTTSLGHIAAIPSLVEAEDAVLLDHQVHHSVHVAVQVARREGCRVELVPHGDLAELDARVDALCATHRRVWILADGVYSMFGDLAPVDHLWALAERYENLWLYVDDAHGMSWCGPRGCGSVLSRVPLHERVVVATSLNKSFAAAGGCLVFGDPDLRRRVFTVGGPMIFSGPIQPPMLGAALASAEIHLSPELDTLQAELRERMTYCTRALRERGLPVVSTDHTPIRFIGVGLPRVARNLGRRLFDEGWFVNVSHFPAVPMKQAGIRFTVTRHHRQEDLDGLADALAHHLEPALREEGQLVSKAWQAFGLTPPPPSEVEPVASSLQVESATTIRAFDPEEWNRFFPDHGNYTWEGLRFLEQTFRHAVRPEERWDFRYLVVRDPEGHPLVATFFTRALWKLDMLEDAAVSEEVERRRETDPDLLVSPVFAMGSLLSEGNHLWIDESKLTPGSPAWEKALGAMLTRARDHADQAQAAWFVLRDLPHDAQLDRFLHGQGFLAEDGEESFALDLRASEAQQVAELPSRHRRFLRREVLPWNDAYRVEVRAGVGLGGDALAVHLRGLYEQVKSRSLELNTFPLPDDFFARAACSPCWEVLLVRPTEAPDALPVGVVAAFHAEGRYCPMVLGMDDTLATERGLYRQILRHVIARARELGASRVELGMGAGLQKRRLGARATTSQLYLQIDDHFGIEVLSQIKAELGLGSA